MRPCREPGKGEARGPDERRRAGHEDDLSRSSWPLPMTSPRAPWSFRQNGPQRRLIRDKPQPEAQAPLRAAMSSAASRRTPGPAFSSSRVRRAGAISAPALDFRGPGGEAACTQPQTRHVRPTRQGSVEPRLRVRAPARADCSERTGEGRNWLSRSKYASGGPTGASLPIDKYICLDK